MIDAFRIDGHTPASPYPYRVTVNGKILRNTKGEPRKFMTLSQAIAAGKGAERVSNPTRKRRGPPKGRVPPHLRKYLFKKGHRR